MMYVLVQLHNACGVPIVVPDTARVRQVPAAEY